MPRVIAGQDPGYGRQEGFTSSDGKLILTDYSDADSASFFRGKKTICIKPKKKFFQFRPVADVQNDYDEDIRYTDRRREDAAFEPVQENRTASVVGNRNYEATRPSTTFMNEFTKIAESGMRFKPSYADCWLVGRRNELEKIAEYETQSGKVLIGTALDGETEYNLMPNEYMHPDSLNAVIGDTIEGVRESFRINGGRMDRQSVMSVARGMIMDYADTVEAVYGTDSCRLESAIGEICDIVYRYTVGLGIFDTLLSDPKLEDIYIDAPCEKNRIHVTMNGVAGLNSHLRCRTNLTVDKKEVMNLINILKRESGLPFCESNPILETDMKAHDARATVVGYPMSPNGDAVAIRKHSTRPWTLTRLVANGTVDARTAGLLSFLVDNRATFLVCGPRGAGKSSLLSALMFEFPLAQRILTIEDTMELPGEMMRRMGYKVQSMLIDDRMEGTNLSRSDEALRVSLRMGESAIVLGEVRGEEAKTLYQSMRTGRAGSSIMGTIHGDCAKSVYERVVHDMNIAPEAFMSTEVMVTLGTIRDRRTGNQIRRLTELVATAENPGEFAEMSGDALFNTPVMRRVLSLSQLSRAEAAKEIRARGMIRAFLAETGNKLGDEYFGPEWVGISNEHVSRNRGRTAEETLESFKAKFRSMTGVTE